MKREKEFPENMHKDPNNWRGLLYFNRKDPRLIVPKINDTDWALNFSSPYSWILIFAIVLIIVASQYLI